MWVHLNFLSKTFDNIFCSSDILKYKVVCSKKSKLKNGTQIEHCTSRYHKSMLILSQFVTWCGSRLTDLFFLFFSLVFAGLTIFLMADKKRTKCV